MLDLTPDEAHRLRLMADDIVTGTQDRAYWLGGARDTSIAILCQVADWLGDACDRRRADAGQPTAPERHRLPCVRPAKHTGRHMDALGQCWETYANVIPMPLRKPRLR
ncbi:hypothetical protein CLV63_13716 [Murinocardiopsis flavida]|uniref:Uncharacterized protein n=1 Tax=Murinocardiopsis flavida TaxID=645275 RepID=A0A2P8CLX1_9ACTN|nr:hypothetical protein [Murinocardiopsis flavida]PSK85957.1 hypothetical protein CLV63_13716 [Murinocardiopsis flavida]